jgi:hypothetical protein
MQPFQLHQTHFAVTPTRNKGAAAASEPSVLLGKTVEAAEANPGPCVPCPEHKDDHDGEKTGGEEHEVETSAKPTRNARAGA